MGKLLDVAYNIEYGAETLVQSSLNLIYLLAYQPDPGNFRMFGRSDERITCMVETRVCRKRLRHGCHPKHPL